MFRWQSKQQLDHSPVPPRSRKRRLKPGELHTLERKFWITAAVSTTIILVLTLLDAYFWGFR